MHCKFLENEKVYLRAPEPEDISNGYIQGINNQMLDLHTEHAIFPKSKAELSQYIISKNANRNSIWLGIFTQDNDKHIGNIELFNINLTNRRAEYAIILWEDHGKGYASAASRLLLNHAFTRLNLNRIELGVNSQNTSAIALYEKLGFSLEAVKKEYIIRNNKAYDVKIYSLFARDFKA